ncbi:methyltransferase domain-containing protein [Aureimonas psammosilenae]|uniref:methyltransferase domain-containing protein n=1 Tax=Aureimonas psammosilenae TaxID=2495496 RepID=UPI0012606D0E|nr:methyltransferase domain-containing protein [Aureimonas psammosilenae]
MAYLGTRRLVPELLDELSPDDPAAIRSRRDLVLVNALMFQPPIMARLLRQGCSTAPRRLLEIGAGDGRFALALARRLAKNWPGVEVTLLDRQDLRTDTLAAAFDRFGWRARFLVADAFAFAQETDERFDAVYANLFLHHFEDEPLARLLRLVSNLAPVFAACEPRRAGFPLLGSRLLWAVGANHVTRHDAPASVRAGFAGRELTKLWPEGEAQDVTEEAKALFTQTLLVRPWGNADP